MNFLKLTNDKLEVGSISDEVGHETCGAISLFVGTTRDNFENKKVVCLEYEAYEPMALKVITTICDDIRKKWPDVLNIAIYHRLGTVPIKDASVVIAISSPHRQSSLDAVQYAIETLKKLVPIWKKEQYENNTAEWKENREYLKVQTKKLKLNFDDCQVKNSEIPKNLCQITTSDSEIQRRINCFIEKKREEININNILDFIQNNNSNQIETNSEYSCARVNSVIFKQKDSKGHLRVNRVKNECGPEDLKNRTRVLDKLILNDIKIKEEYDRAPSLPFGIEERMQNIGSYLNMNDIKQSKNIYERLKLMEDRILKLESISPEYASFMEKAKFKPHVKIEPEFKKKVFTISELDEYINKYKDKKNG